MNTRECRVCARDFPTEGSSNRCPYHASFSASEAAFLPYSPMMLTYQQTQWLRNQGNEATISGVIELLMALQQNSEFVAAGFQQAIRDATIKATTVTAQSREVHDLLSLRRTGYFLEKQMHSLDKPTRVWCLFPPDARVKLLGAITYVITETKTEAWKQVLQLGYVLRHPETPIVRYLLKEANDTTT